MTHGVVHGASQASFCHRNLLDEQRYAQHLRARSEPYVPLEDALVGRGDALTVDDATRAGARAAGIARDLGHSVTFFVNPYHVASGRPYFFSLLNALFDQATIRHVRLGRRSYNLSHADDRKALRYSLRERLASYPTPSAAGLGIKALAGLLGCRGIDLPGHLRVVRAPELSCLLAQGVRVENHGWTHSDLAKRAPPDVIAEIERAREWLLTNLGCHSRFFAPAFGSFVPEPSYLRAAGGPWLLMTRVLSPGRVGPSVFNRVPLSC